MNASPSSADRSESVCTGAEIRLEHVSVAFGEHRIVSDINLHAAAGEFVCLLAPSGCGKSTLLNLVAGCLPAPSGKVSVGGRPVHGPGRDRGVVFPSREACCRW